MLAEKPHFNFSFIESDHAWYSGDRSKDKYDINKIRSLLVEHYPFADFDKHLKDAESGKLRIVIDNGTIEIGESNKDEIKSLIPDDFQMLICYKPKECSILLHRSLSIKIKDDSIDGIIKKHLIEDFTRPSEDHIHLIFRDLDSGKFVCVEKNYLVGDDTITINFVSEQELVAGIQAKLSEVKCISDISPFFLADLSVNDLIRKVCALFKETLKSGKPQQKPTLSIKQSSIQYLPGDGSQHKLSDFNRYKDSDEISKDLFSLFKAVHSFRNPSPGSQIGNNSDQDRVSASTISAGTSKEDDVTSEGKQTFNEAITDYSQSNIQKGEEHVSDGTEANRPRNMEKSPLLTHEKQKAPNDKLLFEKYFTHLKPVKIAGGFTKFSLGMAGRHPHDPVIGKLINQNLAFSELVGELERHFFPENTGHLIDAIAVRVVTQQVNLNFKIDTSGTSKSWSVEVSGNFTKEEGERKQQELKKREEKVAEREKSIESQAVAYKQLQKTLNQIRQEFGLDEETDVLPPIKELKKTSDKSRSDMEELRLITDRLDKDLVSLSTKVESLTTHLSVFTGDDKGFDKIGASQFDDLLIRLKDSYVKLEGINKLRSYDESDLKAFYSAFGHMKSYIMVTVDKLEKSFTSINEKFVVCDAIRTLLSDPEIRKRKLPSLDEINQELKRYGLCIFLPARDTLVEPSRHKVVGYETGGVRGTISSILSWGVIETGIDGSTSATIFKAEVKIYQ